MKAGFTAHRPPTIAHTSYYETTVPQFIVGCDSQKMLWYTVIRIAHISDADQQQQQGISGG